MGILALAPFILGAWLANYGDVHKSIRFFSLAVLGLINFMLLSSGLLLLSVESLMSVSDVPLPPDMPAINFFDVGLAIAITGIFAWIPLIPPARRAIARLIPIRPDSVVHITALCYSIYLAGSTLATWPIIDVIAENEALAEQTFGQLGLTDAWLTGLVFALMAVFGVGLFVKRTGREALVRLKIEGLNGRQIGEVIGAVTVLLIIELGITQIWQALDPDGIERVGGLTDSFISPFLSPAGALTVGLAAGIGEELLFRGALQPRFGIILTTLIFTIAHAQYSLSPALIAIFIVGYALGIIRNRVNTTAAILVHAGFNFLQVIGATYLGG